MKSSAPSAGYKRPRVDLDADIPINTALKRLLAPLAESITLCAAGVIHDADIEHLHDLRVSIRRTRSALAQARHVLPARTVSRFRTDFAWLGRQTGALRDLDVYLAEYDIKGTQTPVSPAPLVTLIRGLREVEHQSVSTILSCARFTRLMRDWNKLLTSPAPVGSTLRDAALPTRTYASSRIRVAYKRVRRQGLALTETSTDTALHELRKACKALRYSIELFESLFPARPIGTFVKTLKQLQDNLGEIQDAVVQAQTLRSLGEQLPECGTAIELLAGKCEHRQRGARETLNRPLQAFISTTNHATFKTLFPRFKRCPA